MPRRSKAQAFRCGTMVWMASILPLFATGVSGQAPKRPNILWISCEDISPDLGCYGDHYSVTPNLDRLARQSVRYTRAFGHAGVCAVNRSGIITAMYPTTIGTQHMRCDGVPPAYVKCFTEYLRAAGYYCTNNVKTDYNFPAPVTAWDENSRQAHWRGRAQGQPFFSVVNFTTTHESKIRAGEKAFADLTSSLSDSERHDPAKAQLPPYYPDTEIVRRDWARYYDLITALDKQVAGVLAELEKDGLADETIVWFWSDHGRGLPRAKRWIYDSGTHVPLLIRTPEAFRVASSGSPGSSNDDLVAFIDFGPTVLSLAGVNVPQWMQGRPFLGSQKAPPRDYVFAARDRMDETYDIIRAVRDKRYKYIRNYEPYRAYAQPIEYMDQMPTMKEMRRLHAEGRLEGAAALFFRETKPVEELYDTDEDPHEINNLADSPEFGEILDRLRRAHEEWRQSTADLGLIPEGILWEERRPGGVWAVTEEPHIEVTKGSDQGRVRVSLSCTTVGASIAYQLSGGGRRHWKLYSGPVDLPAGGALRAKACRLGYRDSSVAQADLAQP